MITFGLVGEDQASEVYQWHRGFTGANDAVRPRGKKDMDRLIAAESVWLASEDKDYLGLAYANLDPEKPEAEVGGLMVIVRARGLGVGSTLMRLALAHIILAEKPLQIPGMRIVAHVLGSNQDPRPIIESCLKFRKARSVEIPGSEVPGLRTDPDGFVRGDEYEMVIPDTLEALAAWAEAWDDRLKGGVSARVELTGKMTIQSWAKPLREMAGKS